MKRSGMLRAFKCGAMSCLLGVLLAEACCAQLKLYYDPLSGNVSFDTGATRSGGINIYYFELNGRSKTYPNIPVDPPWQFRTENLIRLSSSTYLDSKPDFIGEARFDGQWRGLYTIGDVMPIGLSESFWTDSFVMPGDGGDSKHSAPFIFKYVDMVGGGLPPLAEFVYGRPEGEFKNKWDIVDPATLDWAAEGKLIYRPSTGEVLVDTTGAAGGYFSAIVLESNGQFLPAGFDPFFHGPFVDATQDIVGLFGDAFEPGRYSLGEILPTGLTQQQLEALFTRAEFLGRAGFKSTDFNFEAEGLALSVLAVPEPSAILLLAIAGGACLAFRSRT
jgi:hypothetical protein